MTGAEIGGEELIAIGPALESADASAVAEIVSGRMPDRSDERLFWTGLAERAPDGSMMPTILGWKVMAFWRRGGVFA